MAKYDPQSIEPKWQKEWLEEGIYEPDLDKAQKPFYNLMMFPYPSAEGLHVGNMYAFTGADIYGRKKRMEGYNVFEPIGLDGFGIHSENYAMKVGTHPTEQAKRSEEHFYDQLQKIGNGFAWNERLETYKPEYYRWTQWLFLQMWKHDLAYRKRQSVNWCPKDQTVLSDEQVEDGKCERCGTVVIKKELEQWSFRITNYADRLLDNLETLDWSDRVKIAQKNWIGRSKGAEIDFQINTLKKYKFVIFHGYNGNQNSEFIPWLKNRLEGLGCEVIVPLLPHHMREGVSEIEDVAVAIASTKYDENTVIIGHSLGAVVTLKVLEKLSQPIGGVLLVAGFIDPKFKDHSRPFAETFTWKFDAEKIKKNSGFIRILRDSNDSAVSEEQTVRLSQLLDLPIIKKIAKNPHFCASEEPAVFDALFPSIRIFTTRPDTLFGATYLVVAPEHPAIENCKLKIENWDEVQEYIAEAKSKNNEERSAEGREKTGVEIKGITAINPANGEEIPVWVADYVLGSYGTGAIMAVPAHDERDFEFAKKFKLPTQEVVAQEVGISHPNEERRDGGCGVIFDPARQKYAVAIHPDGLVRLFAGGVGDDEDLKSGVLREIVEESGLYDFTHVEKIRNCFTHYYNRRKQVYRSAFATCFLAVLKSDAQRERKLEAHEKELELSWMTPQEILENWGRHNENHDLDHWFIFLREAVARAIELGYDMTNKNEDFSSEVFADKGMLINSDNFSGMDSEMAKQEITKFVHGEMKTQFRLRDWLISRQRYWGPPIPMIFCEQCGKANKGEHKDMPGWYAVDEKELPVLLPYVENFRPTGSGISPLAADKKFYEVKCPACGALARRETDVSDTFLDSAWYYLRYLDKGNEKSALNDARIKHWLPAALYTGGAEHSVLHLLYVRFVAMALTDWGFVDFPNGEPFPKFRAHGLIIKDGAKMSKSKGNVINPDEYIANFGADTLRMYLMFLAPFEQGGDFRDSGVLGIERFLKRAWNFAIESMDPGLRRGDTPVIPAKAGIHASSTLLHKTIKKVTEDVEDLHYNTAISALMILLNGFEEQGTTKEDFEIFLKLLAPFAPHITEEIWRESFGNKTSIHREPWPIYDPKLLIEDIVTIVLQVNGKMRGTVQMQASVTEEEAKAAALADENVKRAMGNATPKKIIYVDKKIVNIVV